jgi:hypothetical protein
MLCLNQGETGRKLSRSLGVQESRIKKRKRRKDGHAFSFYPFRFFPFDPCPLAQISAFEKRNNGTYGRIAITRVGPPEPLAIFIGRAIRVAPLAGNFSIFAIFSSPGLLAPLMI